VSRPAILPTPKSRTTWNLRDVSPSAYRLTSDGRKWRIVCERRRALLLQLASHANPDGRNIWAGRQRLAEALGISIREVGYLLADLVQLKFLRDEGWHGSVRKRSIDLAAILQASRHGQNSQTECETAESGHGQNTSDMGKIEPRHGQNSSGTRPPVVDLPSDHPEDQKQKQHRARNIGALSFFPDLPLRQQDPQRPPNEVKKAAQPQRQPSLSAMVDELWKCAAAVGSTEVPSHCRFLLQNGVQTGLDYMSWETLAFRMKAQISQHGPAVWDVLFATQEKFERLISEKHEGEAATAHEKFGEIAASTAQDQAASVAEKHDGGNDSELKRAVKSSGVGTETLLEKGARAVR
jgi:hypothetical protein